MARRTRVKQLPLDWTTTESEQATPQINSPAVVESLRPVVGDYGWLTPESFTAAEVTGLCNEVADELDWVWQGIDRWLHKRQKPVTVDAYQDLVETVFLRIMGSELSIFEDEEFKYSHITGLDSIFVSLTKQEYESQAFQDGQEVWAYMPPGVYYYQLVDDPIESPEQRLTAYRAQWTKLTGKSLPAAPWEL